MTLLFVPIDSTLATVEVPQRAVRSMPRRAAVSYGTHALVDRKELRQGVSRNADTRALSLVLHVQWCNPSALLEQLRALMNDFVAFSLEHETNPVGVYVIESIDDTPTLTFGDGAVWSMQVEIGLAEPGSDYAALYSGATPPVFAVSGEVPVTTTTQGYQDAVGASPDVVTPAEIARR